MSNLTTTSATKRGHTSLTGRVAAAKIAYSARRVRHQALVVVDDGAPRSGDLVLARVDRLGQHDKLQL